MQLIYLAFLIACTAIRYSHAGKVCSGDYIYKPLTVETSDLNILDSEG